MPSSQSDYPNNAHHVHSYLKRALPNSRLTARSLHSGYQPLLFMSTNYMMAVFAFSNGDMTRSYETLYGSFKEYYVGRCTELDALDLSFVFCVPEDLPNLDRFCSRVETDVYFCRKFVVPIILPLETSFARLPFLPLTPVRGKSMRPPSAQTLLRQCGVPAILAKYLVVPQQRGPDAIVEDCVEARFGNEPPSMMPPSPRETSAPYSRRDAETIRLQSVSIKNFRAYRKTQIFDLSADVTVLYGPNGFGKTSFFDAIDFATTGEIGRLGLGARVKKAKFNKTAAHLDSTPQKSVVSLAFTSNGVDRKVIRRVYSRMHPRLDGRRCDRKTILAEITGKDLAAADRVEHLISLFRATHLFSQEDPELVKGFKHTCELSEQVVSRMLALEDYASASNKFSSVRKIIKAKLDRARAQIRNLSDEIENDKRSLDRLGHAVQEHIKGVTVDQAVKTLRRRVKEAGILGVPTGGSDLAFARSCQTTIQARRSESQARLERLTEIASQVADMPTLVGDLERLESKQRSWKHELTVADAALVAAEEEQRRNDLLLNNAKGERSNAQARSKLLKWVTRVQPQYKQILQQQSSSFEELKYVMSTLDQLRVAESKIVRELRIQERKAKASRSTLQESRTKLIALESLVNAVNSWKSDRERIAAIKASESDLLQTLEKHRLKEKILLSELSKNAVSEAWCRREIDEIDETQSELRQLLSQLEGRVQSGTCPLCGQDHGSKTKLLSRIGSQVIHDSTSTARVELARIQEAGRRLSYNIDVIRSRLNDGNVAIEQLRQESVERIESIEAFENATAKQGLTVGRADITSHEIMHLCSQVREDIAKFNRQVRIDQDKLSEMQATVETLRRRIATSEEELIDVKTAVKDSQAAAARLSDDPRAAEIPLDTKSRKLTDFRIHHRAHVSDVNIAFSSAKNTAMKIRDTADRHRQRVKSIRSELVTLQNNISNLKRTITERKARLKEFKLPSDADESAVFRLIDQETRKSEQLLELRDLAVSLELAIDTATTAAALRHQRQMIRQKERAVERINNIVQRHQPWAKYFDQLSGLVSSQQREAIANFTRQYGPRTSVIQRRLRAVYGFDDIDICSYESNIRVRVKRASEELRPTDYFSQSQQQTLLLGLFLTACISQTWSSLPAVLFDDPITHFDDLNTYAFLDLILGLLDSDSMSRQFILSTCDEKILHLARQKFRHLGERARFYVFSAIDADGPVVEEYASA